MNLSASEERSIAAVDLGSNSFHMVIGQIKDDKVVIIDRIKEMVQLASGLNRHNKLEASVEQRALDCLERFGQRLRGMQADDVSIVGTNTLRRVDASSGFLEKAQAAVGHTINIISGIEEARLIYQGVTQSLSNRDERRLVIDIGGGSTEFIIGEKETPRHLESLYMGCVSFSKRFLGDGKITEKRLNKAKMAAMLELEPHETKLKRLGWDHAIGASGTIRAIDSVIRANGWGDSISRQGLEAIQKVLVKSRHVEKIELAGLDPARRNVFPGGLMVLSACFELLDIEEMSISDGALREGLLFDLAGRISHHDLRENTIANLQAHYLVDLEHAERVKHSALTLLAQLGSAIKEERHILAWAALVHEVGLAMAHSQYHKHGAYILANSDLAGFSLQEQRALAVLVRGHRRKMPLPELKLLPKDCQNTTSTLLIILRIAVLLNRSRHAELVPVEHFAIDGKTISLRMGGNWLASHPLTAADLEEEARYLKKLGYRLEYQA